MEWPRRDADPQLPHSPATTRPFGSARHAPQAPGDASPGTSPLLSGSLGRSDYFEIDVGAHGSVSGRSELFEIDLGGMHRTTSGELSRTSSHVVIDIAPPPPPAPPLSPRAQIEQALARHEFAAPPGPLRDAQLALEHAYVDWAAGVAQKRQAAFGEGRYSVGQGGTTRFGEAVLPALYDGARQFVSSSARSPFQNATMTSLAPRFEQAGGLRVNHGELDNQYDTAVIGGAVGGFTAFAVDSTVLKAMDRRAALANLPKLKAVDLKTLVPDPAPVQLRIVDGRKEYWRPTEAPGGDIETGDAAAQGRASMAELKDGAALRRQSLQRAQSALDASGWGALAQPLFTGALNTLRRVLMPVQALQQVLPVFGGSVLASGGAGAATKVALGLAKPLATATVDDLAGGTQRMSLFATQLPHPEQAPASLADLRSLPGHLKAMALDSAALAAHFVAGPWRDTGAASRTGDAVLARIDDGARVIAANTFASVFANGAGPFAARLLRHDAAGPIAGESQKSGAYLLQQATASFSSDLAWQTLKKGFQAGTLDLAGPLDRWHARQQAAPRLPDTTPRGVSAGTSADP
jgi:hypothetical protein